ncbi:mast cell protease 1A-like [Carassius carassius]|uniref:mast cell protease 1A-like n=1 Tax=Carassius carassius TaxID=217509 RepID=UPI00286883D9|nr:mast cell protease 1A-like [Carassius carassius]
MIIISLLLLASLLQHLTFTASQHVNVGIVNGTEAKPHSRPYMVSVQLNKTHICGGFLISDEFVLTAGHCREGTQILTVVIGAHDLRNSKNSDRIGVNSYIKHPSYIIDSPQNDIMLLRLQEKVNVNNYVNWIPLPKDGEDVEADTICSVAGWGQLETNSQNSNRLMEASVYILNNTECEKKWGTIYSISKMMCTRGHGGSCRYDSGGPLVCRDTAVGITDFGSKLQCNSPQFPNVYTKVSAYIQWINSIIRNVK